MFVFLLFAIGFIILINQNSRISRLEKQFKTGGVPESKSEKPMSSASSVVRAISDNPNTIPTVAQNNNVKTHESNEETSGRFLGKLGIGAVLVGVAFFLKYAFENNWVGPAGRVMIGVLFGLAFVAVGQMLRNKYLKYSDLVIGGGAGILYLSFFSAYGIYHLVSSGVAGLLMLAVTALVFAISIVNATMTLSIVAIVGGFVTPFLVGYTDVYSILIYMTVLNLGVLGISIFKKWPALNAFAFIGMAINFISWTGTFYQKEYLGLTLTFIVVTFLIFIFASIIRAMSAQEKTTQVDFFLLGANAIFIGTSLYVFLVGDYKNILGFISVLVAIVYMFIAYLVNKSNPSEKELNIFLPGLAVVFLSIAVPQQFDGVWVAVGWLVESAILYFIASIISNRGFQVMGVIVYTLGGLDALAEVQDLFGVNTKFVPILNGDFAVLLLTIVVAYFISYMYKRYGSTTVEIQKRGIIVFVIVANIISIYALSSQIYKYYDYKIEEIRQQRNIQVDQAMRAGNSDFYSGGEEYYTSVDGQRNRANTLVSILWAFYAIVLTVIGFSKRIAGLRRMGLILFVITALKVVVEVWSLGEIYRIVSFIVFGIIALLAAFLYAKYKDRLKQIV